MERLAHHRAQSTNSLWRDRPAGEAGFGTGHRRGEVPASSGAMATIWPASGAPAPVCTLVAGESRWTRWNPHRSDRGESQEVPAAATTPPPEVRSGRRRGVEGEVEPISSMPCQDDNIRGRRRSRRSGTGRGEAVKRDGLWSTGRKRRTRLWSVCKHEAEQVDHIRDVQAGVRVTVC